MLTNLFSGGLLFRWVNEFRQDPRTAIISLLIEIPALLFALILHEVAHGYVALRCGDARAANIALLGAFSRLSGAPLDREDLSAVLRQRFRGAVLEMNEKVFALGCEAMDAEGGAQ